MIARFAVSALCVLFLIACATPSLPACQDGALCGLNSPEDISEIPDSNWLIVSQLSYEYPLVLIQSGETDQRIDVTLNASQKSTRGDRDCTAYPIELKPRGHVVGVLESQMVLAVINAGPARRIEIFDIDMTGEQPSLTWSGCINIQASHQLNDIAIGSENRIFATHMFDMPRDEKSAALLRANFLSYQPTGYAVKWHAESGWSKIENTDRSFANGIAYSYQYNLLAIAGTFDQSILLVDLITGERRDISVSLQPDNISVTQNGDFIIAGHTGIPVTGIDPCRSPEAWPCGFPFAVIRMDRTGAFSILLEHDGKTYPGSSSAVLKQNHLYLGTAFGNRLTKLVFKRAGEAVASD